MMKRKQINVRYHNQSIMLGELGILNGNLKSLINKINELQQEISTPFESKKSNLKTSIIIKIPKYLLLTKILPYLSYRECINLSNVSVFIRRSIYSPMGWKVMSQIHTPYDTIVINQNLIKRTGLKKAMTYSSEAEDHLEDYQDQKFLIKQRVKYREVLWTRYKQYLTLKEKNQVLNEKLRIEKMCLFKTKLKKIYFQTEKNDLQAEDIKFKDKLKRLSSDFIAKDDKLTQKIQLIQCQNIKLQKQKQALVGKIIQYQQEMGRVVQKAQCSKRTLGLLKEFMSGRDFQPLEQLE